MQVEQNNVCCYAQSFFDLNNVLLPFWHISVWLSFINATHCAPNDMSMLVRNMNAHASAFSLNKCIRADTVTWFFNVQALYIHPSRRVSNILAVNILLINTTYATISSV